MNRTETLNILKTIGDNYPNYFKDKTNNQKQEIVNVWLESFKNDSYNSVDGRLKDWIKQNKFAPKIADLKNPSQSKKGFNNYTEELTKEDIDVINNNIKKYGKFITMSLEEIRNMK